MDPLAWAAQKFWKKSDYASVSRSAQDAHRPVVLSATGKLDNSLLNMGTGSGLDADMVDGQHASAFAAASHTHSGSAITSGTVAEAYIDSAIARDAEVAAAYAPISHNHDASAITSGTLDDARIPSGIARDSEVMPIVLANDGSGSGLDADLLDGLTSSQFVRNTQITASDSGGGSPAINQLVLSTMDVPAGGYVTLPNEARFLIAHRTGGSATANCILHLAVGGTITSYGGAGINLTNTGNDCVYWNAGSTTYRIGNNSGSVRTWRILLIRG